VQLKAPVFKLLWGRLWGFSPCRGNTLHHWGWNLAWTRIVANMQNVNWNNVKTKRPRRRKFYICRPFLCPIRICYYLCGV